MEQLEKNALHPKQLLTVACRVIELPPRINAVTVEEENGDFTIYVNALLSPEDQRIVYRHERSRMICNRSR